MRPYAPRANAISELHFKRSWQKSFPGRAVWLVLTTSAGKEAKALVPLGALCLWAGQWCPAHSSGMTSVPASLSPWAHSEEASRAGSGSLLICLSWSPLGRELWWGGEKEVAFVAVLILREAIFSPKAHRKSTFLLASPFSNRPALTTPHGPRLKSQKNKQGFDSVVRKSESCWNSLRERERGRGRCAWCVWSGGEGEGEGEGGARGGRGDSLPLTVYYFPQKDSIRRRN